MAETAVNLQTLAHTLVRRMPTTRDNAVCPYRGPVSIDTLPIEAAANAVCAANEERSRRRGLPLASPVSPAEIELVAALWFYGETPLLQHPLGRYDADLYMPEGRLVVEVDGRDWHQDRRRDRRRDITIELEHDVATLRIPAAHVYHDPLAQARLVARHTVQRKRALQGRP